MLAQDGGAAGLAPFGQDDAASPLAPAAPPGAPPSAAGPPTDERPPEPACTASGLVAALGAAVGSLVCDGSIKSLDDEIGLYSVGLRDTPYSKILIRNILQMNSGVTPLNREDVRLASRMAIGMGKFAG